MKGPRQPMHVRPLQYSLCDGGGIPACQACGNFIARLPVEIVVASERRVRPVIHEGRSGRMTCEKYLPLRACQQGDDE